MEVKLPTMKDCKIGIYLTGIQIESKGKSRFLGYAEIMRTEEEEFSVPALDACLGERELLVLTTDGCLVHIQVDFAKWHASFSGVSKLPVWKPRAVSKCNDLFFVVGCENKGKQTELDCVWACEKDILGEYQILAEANIPENLRTNSKIVNISSIDNRLLKLTHKKLLYPSDDPIESLLYIEGKTPNFTFRIADQGKPILTPQLNFPGHQTFSTIYFPTVPSKIIPLTVANTSPNCFDQPDPLFLIISECQSDTSNNIASIISIIDQSIISLSMIATLYIKYHGYACIDNNDVCVVNNDRKIVCCVVLESRKDDLGHGVAYFWRGGFGKEPEVVEFELGEWGEKVPEIQFVFGKMLVAVNKERTVMLFEIMAEEHQKTDRKEDDAVVLKTKTDLEQNQGVILHCSLISSIYRADDTFECQICVVKPTFLYLLNFTSAGDMAMVKCVQLPSFCEQPLMPPSQVYYQGSTLTVVFTWPFIRIVTLEKLNGIITIRKPKDEDMGSTLFNCPLASITPTTLLILTSEGTWAPLPLIISTDHIPDF